MDFIFNPSLVLYLPLHELGGASLASKDAYGHLCTVTGALWRPEGRWFDGSDDFIGLGSHAIFDITDSLTLEAWVYPESVTGDRTFISKGYQGNNAPFNFRLEGNKFNFHSFDNNVKVFNATASRVTTVNRWYHAVATFDKSLSSGNARIYINASLDGTASYTNPLSTNTETVRVGKHTTTAFFSGIIGEVRVYNRALTQQEIQHNYLATKWRYQ